MIKFNKVDFERVQKGLERIGNTLKPYEDKIACVLLFGSLAKGQVGPLSDVDIAVLLKHGIDKKDMDVLENELYTVLSASLGTDELDLVILNKAPLYMRYGVLRDKKILICNDVQALADFFFITVNDYLDIKPLRDDVNREFLKQDIGGIRYYE